MIAKCQWCEEEFTPNRSWQTFCCTDHQQRWHRKQQRGWYAPKQVLSEAGEAALEKIVADMPRRI